MENEEFPGRLEDHAEALAAVVYEVPEYYCKALQRTLFDIEEGFGARLNDLEEKSHPRVKCITKTGFHQLVVNAVRPRDGSQTEIKNLQDKLSCMCIY